MHQQAEILPNAPGLVLKMHAWCAKNKPSRGICAWRAGQKLILAGCFFAASGFIVSLQSREVGSGGIIDSGFQEDMHAAMGKVTAALADRDFPRQESDPQTAADSDRYSERTLLAQGEVESAAEYEINAPESADGEHVEDVVTLNFQAADINALINLVSQITGTNFIVDPRVKGKVTLVSGRDIPADQLYEIFLSVLEVSNFAAVDAGTVTKILPKNLIKQHPTPSSESGLPDDSDAQFTHIVTLDHASVTELLPILRPLLPPTAHIAPHVGSNTLILTGTGSNINRTINLIQRMDREQKGVSIQVIYLKYADASKLAPIVSQAATSFAAENAVQGQAPSTLSVQVDEGLNALIVQAKQRDMAVIQALVDQLDIDRPETDDVHVVYLKYAQATDLVALLNGLQQSGQADDGGAVPRAEVVIQADDPSNALIIKAEQEDFENIKSVIDQLDVRRFQVFIETIIAEVSFDKESELGVDWSANYRTSGGEDLSASTEFTDIVGGFQFGFLDRFFTNLSGDIVPNLNIVLRALRSDTNTNIISTPNLLTLDNEQAEIVVGQEVPFVTGNFTTDSSSAASTADNQGNVTAGVINPFQTIERKDVGLSLIVTPQINDGETIRLEIEQELSSVSTTVVAGASDLVTDTRSIKATVQVDDEQIIVLGGLIRDDAVDTNEWVPVLGKLPLIGALFRKKRKTAVKTNLMVFLKPKIIRTPEDLSVLTEDRYEFIRAEEINSLPDTGSLLPNDSPRLEPRDWQREISPRP